MSSTRSFRVISGPSTLTGTVGSDASPVTGSIWSGTLKQDILLLGGTWPPAGMKTTSGRSATDATSQTKAGSGDLVRLLIESSPAEQRRLWREPNLGRPTPQTRLRQLSDTTLWNLRRLKQSRTYDGNGHLVRSAQEVIEIERMKARRRTLLVETVNIKPLVKAKADELRAINAALYELTKDKTYLL